MSYTREQVETLHDSGKMPDWVYYQLVDVDPNKAIHNQVSNFLSQLNEREQEELIQDRILKLVEDKVQKALDNIFDTK